MGELQNQNTQNLEPNNFIQPQMPEQKKLVPTWLGFVIIIGFAVASFGGAFAYQYFFIPKVPDIVEAPINETAGWKTYKNVKYSYQINYPQGVVVREIDSESNPSACVSITIKDDPLAPIGILIQSNGNTNVPCGNTGRGTTDIRKQDIVNIGGKQYVIDGNVSPDNIGYFSFPLNNLGITYGGNLSDKNLISKLKSILSTFKFIEKSVGCNPLDFVNNSAETKDIVSCFLNNKKTAFKSDLNVSKVLSETCVISMLKDRYIDYKSNQVFNTFCDSCRFQGVEVWFSCSGYSSQFGCYFMINQDKSFGKIYCPSGV